jgi:LytS/YehU family sensor histidine kinase
MERKQWLSLPRRAAAFRIAAAAVTIGAVQTLLIVSVDLVFDGRTSVFTRLDPVFATAFGTTLATATWILYYVRFTARQRQRERETLLQLALREAELQALEAQIHPHFLFNCLNSIRGLVAENPARAQDMITRLANLLRYNLQRDRYHTAPLASEIEIVADYLALESVRFEDRLQVTLDIGDDVKQVPVPTMLLQTLVENALKHGIAPLPEGGLLAIRARVERNRVIVEVENPGRIVERMAVSTQVGLHNSRHRLRILYGDEALLELRNGDGHRVVARMSIPRTI